MDIAFKAIAVCICMYVLITMRLAFPECERCDISRFPFAVLQINCSISVSGNGFFQIALVLCWPRHSGATER